MSDQENTPRLDNRRIIAIALVLVLFPTGLIISISASGGSGPAPQNNCAGTPVVPYGRTECGSGTCTMAAGATQCSTAITFPVPFSTAPTPPTGGIDLPLSTVPSGTLTTMIPQSYTTWTFFSTESAGQTWLSIPAAQTEIFGDNGQHWIIADWSNQTQADFYVNCVTIPTSATDNNTWTVQYSADKGVTFNSIPQLTVGTGFQISASHGNCDVPSISDACMLNNGVTNIGCYFTIPAPARIVGVYLRIVSQGGTGVGDNEAFQSAYIITHTASSSLMIQRLFSMKLQNLSAPSTTGFTPFCVTNVSVGTATCNFKWIAFSAVG